MRLALEGRILLHSQNKSPLDKYYLKIAVMENSSYINYLLNMISLIPETAEPYILTDLSFC